MNLALFARTWLLCALLFGAGQTLSSPLVDPLGILVDKGSATLDTRSGRQWLDMTASHGLSYNDMKSTYGCDPTCTSGPYAGWTFAQAGDVRQLVEDAGLAYGVDLFSSPGPAGFVSMRERLVMLISLLGGELTVDLDRDCFPACGAVHGILNRILTDQDLAGNTIYPDAGRFSGFVQQASIAAIPCCGDFWAGDNLSGPQNMVVYGVDPLAPSASADNGDPFFTGGVWLYHVPEPSTFPLAALALASLMAMGRRTR